MRLPPGLTDDELVRLWHGTDPIAVICQAWGNIPEHHIYWSWSRLKKEHKIPPQRRGFAGRTDPGTDPTTGKPLVDAVEEDLNVPEAPAYIAARIDYDGLLERLIRVHGPAGRPDIQTFPAPGSAAQAGRKG